MSSIVNSQPLPRHCNGRKIGSIACSQNATLRSLADLQSGENPPGVLEQVLTQEDETSVVGMTGRRALFYLTRLQQTFMQLAAGLGARIQEP